MNRIHRSAPALPRIAACLFVVGSLTGCGEGRSPVRGQVTYADGTPLSWGTVVFEGNEGGKAVMARGDIQEDGTFTMGTEKPGDGVVPGKYRVLVTTPASSEGGPPLGERDRTVRGPTVDSRYKDFNTSGLEFEVKPGPNEFPIKVTKPGQHPR